MNVGIVGLGLIGGSLAKAYKAAGHKVYALDTDAAILNFAVISGVVDTELTRDNMSECELMLIAINPGVACDFLKENCAYFAKDGLVIDCCGIKREICALGFELAAEHGFVFVGGHPMAGSHRAGFKNSRANLFSGAPMVLVPHEHDDIELLDRVKNALAAPGFGRMTVTTAQEHDRMIAFTSQLAHAASSAYIKSPTAREHKGYSAGSYKDMTRVAWLNPDMWAELFCSNSDYLIDELSCLIDELTSYRDALAQGDRARVRELLEDGRRAKQEVDGR